MFDFIDMTEATTGFPIAVKPMEIKMLVASSIGTQVHAGGCAYFVKESIEEIKAMCKKGL